MEDTAAPIRHFFGEFKDISNGVDIPRDVPLKSEALLKNLLKTCTIKWVNENVNVLQSCFQKKSYGREMSGVESGHGLPYKKHLMKKKSIEFLKRLNQQFNIFFKTNQWGPC